MNLDKYENLEDTFSNIDAKFITKIRDVLLNDEILLTRDYIRMLIQRQDYRI